ncbi:MAG TPA: hypothetical protein VF063_03595 [Gaiellaceae bacterium]
MRTRARVLLLLLLLAAVILVAVELGKGAVSYGSGTVANPCQSRSFAGSGIDAAVQRVVLDGLDGAACRLGTSREALVLSLSRGSGFPHRHFDRQKVENALRAGMLAALDRAEQRGDIPSFLAALLRQGVQSLPLDQLLRGAFGL